MTSFSVPSCMSIQAHWIASRASKIIMEVWGVPVFLFLLDQCVVAGVNGECLVELVLLDGGVHRT